MSPSARRVVCPASRGDNVRSDATAAVGDGDADDAAAVDHEVDIERDRRPVGVCAEDGARPARRERPDRLAERRRAAGRFDHVVHAAAELSKGRDGVDPACVDSVGGTKLASEFEARRDEIDGHDPRHAGQGGRHDGGAADRAGAEHGQRGARLGAQRVQHCARAGLDAATQRGEDGERSILRHLDEAAFVHEGVTCERRLPEEVPVQGLAALKDRVTAVAPGAAKEVERVEMGAVCGPS